MPTKSEVTRGKLKGIRKQVHKGPPRPIKPITNKAKTNQVKIEAQQMGNKPYMLILIGLNTGLRISDILKLRVGDFRDTDRLIFYEQKTGKRTEIPLNDSVIHDVNLYTRHLDDDELVFASERPGREGSPIAYMTAYRWVKEACRRAGIEKYVGCHTLRKTYGYTRYKEYGDVAELMEHFNHSSQRVTLRYIGITQEVKDSRARKLLI